MIRFATARMLSGLAVAFIVVTAVFFVTRVIADPVALMLTPTAPQEQIDALRSSLGFDQSIINQYLEFLKGVPTLNFGDSFTTGLPVRELILNRTPATLQLVAGALVLCALVFVPLGILAGRKPGSIADQVVVNLSLFMISIPGFWLGTILILIFAVKLGWLPTSGSGNLSHMLLPTITLSLVAGARIASIARATIMDENQAPYVTALRGRGFSEAFIVRNHMFRNALLPIVTIFFWEAAVLVANSLIVETVFSWPGVGQLIVQSVNSHDFPVLQGAILAVAMMVVSVNTLADIVYRLVDPRIELT